jgi:hypothetical protein
MRSSSDMREQQANDEILIPTVLVPDTGAPKGSQGMIAAELLSQANEHRITKLIEICRKVSPEAEERPAPHMKVLSVT